MQTTPLPEIDASDLKAVREFLTSLRDEERAARTPHSPLGPPGRRPRAERDRPGADAPRHASPAPDPPRDLTRTDLHPARHRPRRAGHRRRLSSIRRSDRDRVTRCHRSRMRFIPTGVMNASGGLPGAAGRSPWRGNRRRACDRRAVVFDWKVGQGMHGPRGLINIRDSPEGR